MIVHRNRCFLDAKLLFGPSFICLFLFSQLQASKLNVTLGGRIVLVSGRSGLGKLTALLYLFLDELTLQSDLGLQQFLLPAGFRVQERLLRTELLQRLAALLFLDNQFPLPTQLLLQNRTTLTFR